MICQSFRMQSSTARYLSAFGLITILSVLASACASSGSHAMQDPGPHFLPADTLAWVGITNSQHTADALDFRTAVDLLGNGYEEYRQKAEEAIGFAPFNAASMARAGLNPTRPLGMAWINEADELGAVYGHISDIAQFMVAMDRLAASLRGKRSSESIGEGTVHTFGDRGRRKRVCVAIRGDVAIAFITGSSRGAARVRSGCYGAAAGKLKNSLHDTPKFGETIALLQHGRDGYGYVDLRVLAGGRDTAEAGASSGVNRLSFGIDLTKEHAKIDVRLAMAAGSSQSPLRNGPATQTASTTSVDRPMASLSVRFDPAADPLWLLRALASSPLKWFFGADTNSYKEALRQVGVDNDRDLKGNVDGTAELVAGCGVRADWRDCAGFLQFGLHEASRVSTKPSKDIGIVGNRLIFSLLGDGLKLAANASKPISTAPPFRDLMDTDRAGRLRVHGRLLIGQMLKRTALRETYSSSSWNQREKEIVGPEADAIRKELRELERVYDAKEEAHFAPIRTAWDAFTASLDSLDLGLVNHPKHVAFLGGMMPLHSGAAGVATWGKMWRDAGRVRGLAQKLRASQAPHEKAYNKAQESLYKKLWALPKTP